MKFFALLTLAVSFSLAGKVRYDGYKLYQLAANDRESLLRLKQLNEREKYSDIQFWNHPLTIGLPVTILVSPSRVDDIEYMIKSRGMNSSVMMENVQEYIDKQGVRAQSKEGSFDWTSYHTYDQYVAYLKSLEEFCSGVTLLKVGTSYEGRDLLGVHVTFSPKNKKNAIFLESLIHAREWISGAVSTYILNEILTNTDTAFRKVVERYDWYVFPIFNPDGYVYSYTYNHMWRKTRSPTHRGECVGVNANRNWKYLWNTGGPSSNPCSDDYIGSSAFSEPCTKYMSQFISTIGDRLIAYISFQNFGQKLLIPYGHTDDHLDNYDVTDAIALKAIRSLAERYGTKYQVGTVLELEDLIIGSSTDWVKATFGTPLVYTYKLPDDGHFGHLIPPDNIIRIGLETMDSLVTMLEEYERTK